MTSLDIYTDGSVNPNPGFGGWAAVITDSNKTIELTGQMFYTTNNLMELRAILEAVRYVKKPCAITVYSDSQIAVNSLNGGFNPKNPGIVELVKAIRAAVKNGKHAVKFVHVKGHAESELNHRADALAYQAQTACFEEAQERVVIEYPDSNCEYRQWFAEMEYRRHYKGGHQKEGGLNV